MTNSAEDLERRGEVGQLLPLILLMFVASGCAALIYEIVWFQVLELVIGSTSVSLAVLLATFMGGMCLGSLWFSHIAPARWHPLRVYAALELGIGIIGVAELFVMPLVNHIYTQNVAPGMYGFIYRGLLAAVCLIPPTILMGATLPAMSRWVKSTPRGVSWLGLFYGANTVGAVGGCVLAGFYLLREYDITHATFFAASINLILAILAYASAAWAKRPTNVLDKNLPTSPGVMAVYLVIGLSGATALGGEVIWTRLLALLLGGTVYTFSIILAVLLSGLAIGGSLGAMASRHHPNPRKALGICQLFLVASIAWAALAVARSLPWWPVNPQLATRPLFIFQIDLVRVLFAIFPAALFWGASFPLALTAASVRQGDLARPVGAVYASNTLGAILGAIFFSVILIPEYGTQHAQQILLGLTAISAVIALSAELSLWAIVRGLLICGVVAIFIWTVAAIPWELVAYGHYIAIKDVGAKPLYVGEGMNSTVAVTEWPNGTREFHVAGKTEASTSPEDMRVQRMLGHIPALLHGNAHSALVVGCGAGVTAGSLIPYPEISKITICEIEPLVPQHIADYFSNQNYGVVHNEKVHIVFDDARHFVLTTHEKFDIITSDPIHPWVKGAASLYTKEYFQMVKDHLNPGGMVTQWVPLYDSSEDAVKAEIATFFSVFPNGTIWANDIQGQGYDVVLLGGTDDLHIDVDAIQSRWDSKPYRGVFYSLEEVQCDNIFTLLNSYSGNASDMKTWLADAQINLDKNLRLQYLAGMSATAVQGNPIYQSILSYRTFPTDMITGSEASLRRAHGSFQIRIVRD